LDSSRKKEVNAAS